MKNRRFSITEEEAELIKIALISGIEDVSMILDKEPRPYFKVMKMKMEDLLQKLRDYKFTVD